MGRNRAFMKSLWKFMKLQSGIFGSNNLTKGNGKGNGKGVERSKTVGSQLSLDVENSGVRARGKE